MACASDIEDRVGDGKVKLMQLGNVRERDYGFRSEIARRGGGCLKMI